MIAITALAFANAALPSVSAAPELVAESHYPLVEASVYRFHSTRADRDLRLMVSLPASYATSGEDQRYPVIYVVDGQWHFNLAQSVAGGLAYDKGWQDSIVVGITWAGDVGDANRLRFEDLTISTPADRPTAGKADRYLDFLQHELMPWVDREFRSNDERALVGSSLGGLLSLYCLFTRPALFTDYLASTPSIGWDGQVIRKHQAKFLAQPPSEPVNLYLARGGMEWGQAGLDAYAEELEALDNPALVVGFDVIEGAGHGGLNPEAFTRGLQFFFANRKRTGLDVDLLSAYTGTYGGGEGLPLITVRAEDGQLYARESQGNNESRWVAVGDNRFYLTGLGAEASFVIEGDQPASELVIETEVGELRFTRQAQ